MTQGTVVRQLGQTSRSEVGVEEARFYVTVRYEPEDGWSPESLLSWVCERAFTIDGSVVGIEVRAVERVVPAPTVDSPRHELVSFDREWLILAPLEETAFEGKLARRVVARCKYLEDAQRVAACLDDELRS